MEGIGSAFSEVDSQAALEELDRGIRSGNIGDQCEAIIKIPHFLERYPFPLFVSGAFLKISSVFKEGNNLLRKCIVGVAKRFEKHLDKLISVEELLRRIFSVSYSNDPVARSLTLQLLGCLAPIFAEKKNVHHLLSNSFDSRDGDELRAAIQASQCYARYSAEFSQGILEKVEKMLVSVETPVETKMYLIPVFRFMHIDAVSLKRVFRLCQDTLLADCPNDSFRALILSVLTELAKRSLPILQDHISLMLSQLGFCTRKRMKILILKNLKSLARHSPHMWNAEFVKKLVKLSIESPEEKVQYVGLKVISELTSSMASAIWLKDYVSDLGQLCSSLCFCQDSACLSAISVQILHNICEVLSSIGDHSELAVTLKNIEVDALMNLLSRNNRSACCSSCILKQVVTVASKSSESGIHLVDILFQFAENNSTASGDVLLGLTALAESSPSFYSLFWRWALHKKYSFMKGIFIEFSNLLLPPISSVTTDTELLKKEASLIFSDISSLDLSGWHLYLLGRKAMRNGWSPVAYDIFSVIEKNTVTTRNHNFVRALSILSQANCRLQCDIDKEKSLTTLLDEVYQLYLTAALHLQLATSVGGDKEVFWFPLEFVMCRASFFEACRDLTLVWSCLKILPPPTALLVAENESERLSKVEAQFSKCAIQFRRVSKRYSDVMKRCFDADESTLNTLNLLRLDSSLVDRSLGQLLGSATADIQFPDEIELSCCNKMKCRFQKLVHGQLKKIRSGIKPESAKEVVEFFLEGLSNLLKQPIYFPRYFFQTLQQTDIRPQGLNTAYSLALGQELVIKVEGVIQFSGQKRIRNVSQVTLNVALDHTSVKEGLSFDKEAKMAISQNLTKAVTPLNDYFVAEFLLSFPQNCQSGVISVTADLVDVETERLWYSGAFAKLKVNVAGGDTTSTSTSVGVKRKATDDSLFV